MAHVGLLRQRKQTKQCGVITNYLMFERWLLFCRMQCLKSACLVSVIREHKLSDDFEYTCPFVGNDRILYFPVFGFLKPYIVFCSCKRTDRA